MKNLFYILLFIALTAVGCATGRKAYLKGDYYKSVTQALNRLQQKPSDKTSKDILHFAYPELIKYEQNKINTFKTSSDPLRWEKVMESYTTLNGVYDHIQRTPAAHRMVDAKSFSKEYEEARRNAAEMSYQQGLKELNFQDRVNNKRAYRSFQRALDLRPDHTDARKQLDLVRDKLMTYVVVQSIPMHSAALSLSNAFFEQQMMEYFRRYAGNEFVRFYSADEKPKYADHYLVMRFDDFAVGQMSVHEKEAERTAQVVTGKTQVTKDSTANIYATVKAKVRLFNKSLSSGGLLDVKIIDARNNAIVSQQKFSGTFVWEDRWGTYMGDERALNKEDREYTNRRETMPPPPQQLFIEFTKPIYGQTTNFVDNFYKSF